MCNIIIISKHYNNVTIKDIKDKVQNIKQHAFPGILFREFRF